MRSRKPAILRWLAFTVFKPKRTNYLLPLNGSTYFFSFKFVHNLWHTMFWIDLTKIVHNIRHSIYLCCWYLLLFLSKSFTFHPCIWRKCDTGTTFDAWKTLCHKQCPSLCFSSLKFIIILTIVIFCVRFLWLLFFG